MAKKKLQHFVPRVYLRAWSNDSRSIALYNIRQKQTFPLASIKGQCARNYFYGEDCLLENSFALLEGEYASLTKDIAGSDYKDLTNKLKILRVHAHIQFTRTAQWADISRELAKDLCAISGEESNWIKDRRLLMADLLDNCRRADPYMKNMNGVLLQNDTTTEFITSDDPVVFFNPFVAQAGHIAGGINTPGFTVYMPISPKLAIFYYDREVYHIPSRVGAKVTIGCPRDIERLNLLEVIKADENMYFSQPSVWDTLTTCADWHVAWAYRTSRSKQIAVNEQFVSKSKRNGITTSVTVQGDFVISTLLHPSFLSFPNFIPGSPVHTLGAFRFGGVPFRP